MTRHPIATTPVSRYLQCVGREIHFMDWAPAPGVPEAPTVIAWHGLARTGRDMDALAAHLSALGHRVICPDTIGRGLSQWSPEPETEYCLAFYARIATELVNQLKLEQLSLGGHVHGRRHWHGLRSRAAARAAFSAWCSTTSARNWPRQPSSASVPMRATRRRSPPWANSSSISVRFTSPTAILTDAQWTLLTESSTRRLPNGWVTPHYDPAMVMQFTQHPDDYALWDDYDRIDVPVLCLRGETSDLLLVETAEAMRDRGPRALVVTIEGCGHAPALNVPEQLALVQRFLMGA